MRAVAEGAYFFSTGFGRIIFFVSGKDMAMMLYIYALANSCQ